MAFAARHGAKEGESFLNYIDYLVREGYVPPNGRPWVDKIRTKGNEATHQLPSISKQDAELVVRFTEMLLRFTFEMPSMLEAAEQSGKGTHSAGSGSSAPKPIDPLRT